MTTWTGYTDNDDDCEAPSSSVLVERVGQRCLWQVSGKDASEVESWENIFLDESLPSTLLDQNKQEHSENIMPLFCQSNRFQGDNCLEWGKSNFILSDSIKNNLCGEYSEWDQVPTECKCMRRDLNPLNIKLQNAGAYVGSPACVDTFCMGDDGDPQFIPSSMWPENIDCTGSVCQNIVHEGDLKLDIGEQQELACGFGDKAPPPPSFPGISPSFSNDNGEIQGTSNGVGFSQVDLFAMVLDTQTYFLIVGFIAVVVPILGSLFLGREGLISWEFLLVYGLVVAGLVLFGILRKRITVFENDDS